jgi:NADPH:quinone reductase-like Zn-dependent oxidoreductase
MKSVGYYTKGGTETLVEIELPMPQPGPRDLLVSVRAVSVNPVDVKRRRWEDPADGSTHSIGFRRRMIGAHHALSGLP